MVVVERIKADAPVRQIAGQAHPLELAVECPLGNGIIREGIEDILRYLLAAGKVNHLHGTAVHGVSEQQYFKIGSLGILIDAAFLQVVAAKSLQIDTHRFHIHHPFQKGGKGNPCRPSASLVVF